MSWKTIVNSATGTSHQNKKTPCQDYGSYEILDLDVIVGAVADGAGSAKNSEVGSSLAVKTALSYLKKCYESYKIKGYDLPLTIPITKKKAENIFDRTLAKVKKALVEEAEKINCSTNDLACTLLVFIATPNWIAAMQIGDGFIVVGLEKSPYQLLFPPDKGEYANQTTFVTSANASSKMQVRVLEGKQEFVCASTDGLEKLAIDFRTGIPYHRFFNAFEEGLKNREREEEQKSLREWLNSQEVNARTDDDKTLLLCLYERYPRTSDSRPQAVIPPQPSPIPWKPPTPVSKTPIITSLTSSRSISNSSAPVSTSLQQNKESHHNTRSNSKLLLVIQNYRYISNDRTFVCFLTYSICQITTTANENK
ncbi:MAG: PP2C family serine/threonine-protein phosphatase [Cyanobacteria bacterium P01_C01_bin.38]